MPDKKYEFTKDPLKKATNVFIVDNEKDADIVINEKNLSKSTYCSSEKLRITKNRRNAKKVYVKKNSNDKSGCNPIGALFMFIFVTAVAPFFTFKGMALWHQISTVFLMLTLLYISFLEPILFAKYLKANNYSLYIYEERPYRIISKILCVIVYFIFGIYCYRIQRRFEDLNYITAKPEFSKALIIFGTSCAIILIIETLFRIFYTKYILRCTTAEYIKKNIVFLISVVLIATILYLTSFDWIYKYKQNHLALIYLNSYEYVYTEDYTEITFKVQNVSDEVIHEIENVEIVIWTENVTKEMRANKKVDILKFENGGIPAKSTSSFTLKFFYDKGEAEQRFWDDSHITSTYTNFLYS